MKNKVVKKPAKKHLKGITYNEMLAQLRTFFSQDHAYYYEQSRLWDILCALRGPDFHTSNMDRIKAATTEVIRFHLFGVKSVGCASRDSAASAFMRRAMLVRKAETEKLVGSIPPWSNTAHFLDHAKKAFLALDLKWSDLNE